MAIATFKIDCKEYVIIPRKRYEHLVRAEQDLLDAKIAQEGRDAYLSGKMKTISHKVLKCRLAGVLDKKGAAVARKGRAAYLAGTLKAIPLAAARRPWGV